MSLQKHQVLSIAHNDGHSLHEGHNMQSSVYTIVTACEWHCMQRTVVAEGVSEYDRLCT